MNNLIDNVKFVLTLLQLGGTVTGKRISSIAGPMLKKLQLELGGKNPAIVFNGMLYNVYI